MIYYLKFIFVWIFLIPQPTGNGFCTAIFSVYFLLSYHNSIVSSYDALYLDEFYISTAADCGAFSNACDVLIQNQREAVLVFIKIESTNCCNLNVIKNILLQMAEVSHGTNLFH